jgi:hypothetical protein
MVSAKVEMSKEFMKKYGLHVLLWAVMFFYFIFSPQLIVRLFNKHGKPIQVNANIPADSGRIHFVVEDLLSYLKDGENLYQLYGWSFILPETDAESDMVVRELALVAEERNYVFAVRPEHRIPNLPGKFTDLTLDFDTLGFSVLIAEDVLQPGKYRIGMVFRNASGASAVYRDKPVYYLVKTPNTLRLETK